MDFDAIFQLTVSMSNICQSFQTLYEASLIINVTHRSFAVFHPIMYVAHRSFAAPAPATRDFFWLYHTYSLLRGGFYNASSGYGLLAKTLRGQQIIIKISSQFLGEIQLEISNFNHMTPYNGKFWKIIESLSQIEENRIMCYGMQNSIKGLRNHSWRSEHRQLIRTNQLHLGILHRFFR